MLQTVQNPTLGWNPEAAVRTNGVSRQGEMFNQPGVHTPGYPASYPVGAIPTPAWINPTTGYPMNTIGTPNPYNFVNPMMTPNYGYNMIPGINYPTPYATPYNNMLPFNTPFPSPMNVVNPWINPIHTNFAGIPGTIPFNGISPIVNTPVVTPFGTFLNPLNCGIPTTNPYLATITNTVNTPWIGATCSTPYATPYNMPFSTPFNTTYPTNGIPTSTIPTLTPYGPIASAIGNPFFRAFPGNPIHDAVLASTFHGIGGAGIIPNAIQQQVLANAIHSNPILQASIASNLNPLSNPYLAACCGITPGLDMISPWQNSFCGVNGYATPWSGNIIPGVNAHVGYPRFGIGSHFGVNPIGSAAAINGLVSGGIPSYLNTILNAALCGSPTGCVNPSVCGPMNFCGPTSYYTNPLAAAWGTSPSILNGNVCCIA